MAKVNQFVIRNSSCQSLTLNIEPEGALIELGHGDEVTVIDQFQHRPVTIEHTKADDGSRILSIWPGDGDVRVERGGVDVLELLQEKAAV